MLAAFQYFHSPLIQISTEPASKNQSPKQKADTEPTMLMKRTRDTLRVLRELVGAAECAQSNFMDTTGF